MNNNTKTYKITPKQDKFAYYLSKGFSQRQAYYKAYPKSQKWATSTTDSKASNLFKVEKVAEAFKKYFEDARLQEEKNIEERTVILDEDIFGALVIIADDYEDVKNFIQEAIIKNLPDNHEKIDNWLSKNRRQNITESVRYEVLSKANFRCEACGDSPKVNNSCVLHVDHIVPHSLGGMNNMTNYQCLCERCNVSKGNRYAVNNHKEYVNI